MSAKSARVYAIIFAVLGVASVGLGIAKVMHHQQEPFYVSFVFGVAWLAFAYRYWLRSSAPQRPF